MLVLEDLLSSCGRTVSRRIDFGATVIAAIAMGVDTEAVSIENKDTFKGAFLNVPWADASYLRCKLAVQTWPAWGIFNVWRHTSCLQLLAASSFP